MSLVNVGVSYNDVFYNSYLILGEKNVLIDTVPSNFCDEFVENIQKHINISNLDAVIINHTESDRSGCLMGLLSINPDIEIIASLAGLKNLEQQLNIDFNKTLAKSNMIYKISDGISLKFIITHNINWPDSMMTYYIEEKILFSCDAFSDENNLKKDYFYEKLYPMSKYVQNAMQQLENLDILIIYPGSGNKTDNEIIKKYISWCNMHQDDDVLLIYESHSGNTKELAHYAKNQFDIIKIIDVLDYTDEEIYEMIYNSSAVIFGVPTEYRNIPKRTRDIICGINHYKIDNTKFAAFGSYGWSGEATNLVYSMLKSRHFSVFKSPFRVMFKPTDNDYEMFNKYLSEFLE